MPRNLRRESSLAAAVGELAAGAATPSLCCRAARGAAGAAAAAAVALAAGALRLTAARRTGPL
ncbi:MAG TPA: hypothetical protein VGK58_10140 [Lacipirellulaceae bacterium]